MKWTIALALPLAVACAASPPTPISIKLDGAVSRPIVAADAPQTMVARLTVTAPDVGAKGRPPLFLALAIDSSASMRGAPIEGARAAAREVVGALTGGDRLSIITFDSNAKVRVPLTEVGPLSRARMLSAIDSIEATGSTDLAGGLTEALAQIPSADSHAGPALDRVMVLSDGLPNDGTAFRGLLASAASRRIQITTLGLGTEYDEALLASFAMQTQGAFHYIESPADAARVFRDEVARVDRSAIKDVIVKVSGGPGILVARAESDPAQPMARTHQVRIGTMASGATQDILLRVTVPGRPDAAHVELLDATVSFSDLTGHAQPAVHVFLEAQASADEGKVEAAFDPGLEAAARDRQAAAALVEANRLARIGQVDGARQRLARARASNAVGSSPKERAALGKKLDTLEAQLPDLAAESAGKRPSASYDRGWVKSNHSSAMDVLTY